MRNRIWTFLAILGIVANPTGVHSNEVLAAEAKPAAVTTLKFDTNTYKLVEANTKTDFTDEFTIPAHRFLIEREKARLAARAASIRAKLAANGFSTNFAELYLMAQDKTGTPWQLIAATHKIETGQRGDTTVASYAGAQGPMQFIRSTWSRYAVDGDGDGDADIYSVDDAVVTAGRYLAACGAGKGNYYQAALGYNHADWYAQSVLGMAHRLGL